jgi:hypothetical protein
MAHAARMVNNEATKLLPEPWIRSDLSDYTDFVGVAHGGWCTYTTRKSLDLSIVFTRKKATPTGAAFFLI